MPDVPALNAAALLWKYFGPRNQDQTLMGFAQELKELPVEDKLEMAREASKLLGIPLKIA